MAVYGLIAGASNLSVVIVGIEAQQDAMRGFERGTVTPTIKPTGLLWNRTDEDVIGDALKRWNGTTWTLFADPEFAQINAGGTVALGANLPAGGFKLTGLAAGSAAGDSVRYEQVLLLSGANAMIANLAMGGNRITNLGAPSSPTDAARVVDAPNTYFQTNADLRGNAKPVKYDTGAGSADITDCGFAPRNIRLRIVGGFYRQSDNASMAGAIDTEIVATRYESDASYGLTVPNPLVIAIPGTTPNAINAEITWSTSTPLGFKLTFKRASDGALCKLRKVGGVGGLADGVMQVLAVGGALA